jgi:HD-like signal output (HDOD) protein
LTRFDEYVKDHNQSKLSEEELRKMTDNYEIEENTPDDLSIEDCFLNLKHGMAALDTIAEASGVVQLFVDLAKKYGARALLLRKWSKGLRVLLAENATLPEEYLTRGNDSPKLISTPEDDVFTTAALEKTVYHGCITEDHFPRELSRLLGGIESVPVVIIPLPLRSKWDTFLYLDWRGLSAEERVQELAFIAKYAVLRLICLDQDILPMGQHIQEMQQIARQAQKQRIMQDLVSIKPGDYPLDDVYSGAGELAAIPQVALRILDLLKQPGITAKSLGTEISKDLVLTAKLLRIANSSFYQGMSDVKTIRDTIVRLGFKDVRNWTLVVASRTAFPGIDTNPLMNSIWRHSLLSALGCQIVSERLKYNDPETVFVGGLMQNIGQLIMVRSLPGFYEMLVDSAARQDVPTWKLEQEHLGYDHGELGAKLIKDWGLGDDLAMAVRCHHRLSEDSGQNKLSVMIALGEELGNSFELEKDDLKARFVQSVAAARLTIDWNTYQEMTHELSEMDISVTL